MNRLLTSPLACAPLYQLFRVLGGAHACYGAVLAEDARPAAGEHVLDVGCGTGPLLNHLPAVTYLGVDTNPRYLALAARQARRLNVRATFTALNAAAEPPAAPASIDLALAFGVLHHLDDAHAASLLRNVSKTLKHPGGRLVTLDPVRTRDASSLARLRQHLDRGAHIRTEAACRQLVESVFPNVRARIERRHLRPKAPLLILTARNPSRP